jgi:hypothetical protein
MIAPRRGGMSSRSEPVSYHDALAKIMKYCKTCQRETPHQIRGGPGMGVVICVPCLSRALTYELGRD